MASDRVTFTLDGGVARVSLAAPGRHNAIDPQWVEEFAAAVERCGTQAGVRAVLLTAEGPSFTVGGDLRHFTARQDDVRQALTEMVPQFHVSLGDLAHLPVPVVAAVQGAIAGGGLGVAWGADLVLAAENAVFATGFHKLGLSGDGGSSWWLPRLIGYRRAQQMIIGGRVLDAATALDWGLVTEILPLDELAPRAEALAAELAAGPTFGYARMRALLQDAATRPLREHLAAETEAILDCGGTTDAREGVVAFVEKRPPVFTGA